jgi:hypothetical protein
MNPSELEKKATIKARTVDPSVLPVASPPFPPPEGWMTWLSDQGQWIFVEKEVVNFIASAFGQDHGQAFQFIGQEMLKWLKENGCKVKPRDIWKIVFMNRGDAPVNFAVFNNQCFVFMPRRV